jgi:hypothetical protein
MDKNLDCACDIAHFARDGAMEVFYQPIEQNYNTPVDLQWFDHSSTWPKDTAHAVATIEKLINLKREGLPIANSIKQLEVMIPYFRDPEKLQRLTRSHSAHQRRFVCSAATFFQVQANGDVRCCSGKPPVGNIKTAPIRVIWRDRPHWWESGCCFEPQNEPVQSSTLPQR